MVTGWAYLDGAWYYLTPSGAMAIGWLHEGGSWYYLDPATGAMVTGSQQVNGVAYTFGPDGRMQ